jgi:predicted phosphate transport protein (TIGR00153 family)
MFIGKTELKVRDNLLEHCRLVQKTLDLLVKVVEAYAAGGAELEKASYDVHKTEHEADVVRRQIHQELAGGAFLPFYREDYIRLSEMIDKVANRAVAFAKALSLEKPKIPEEVVPGLVEIARVGAQTFGHFLEIIPLLFSNAAKALQYTERISEGEQKSDSLEWQLQKRVFSDPAIDRAEMIFVAGTIQRLASVLDSIENAADHVRIIVAKMN